MIELVQGVALALACLLLAAALGWLVFRRRRPVSPGQALARLAQQREHLEADFFRAASASRKPRGLRWKHCEWEKDILLARDRKSGELTALVGMTIQFEAIEGSDMEGLPAVGNLRHASGVFFFRGGRWRTIGKAVFNLNPAETIEFFKQQYERVEPA
jgi:hypothetical protein